MACRAAVVDVRGFIQPIHRGVTWQLECVLHGVFPSLLFSVQRIYKTSLWHIVTRTPIVQTRDRLLPVLHVLSPACCDLGL